MCLKGSQRIKTNLDISKHLQMGVGFTKHNKRQNKNFKTDQHQHQTYLARTQPLLNEEFEVTPNTVKSPRCKVDSVQQQIGGVTEPLKF